MKKALSFTLALILSLSVFAGVTVFAVEPVEWDHILVLGYSGYEYHKPAESIAPYFAYTEWGWAFDEVSAYLEADGEQVTGLIESGIEYTLVIRLKLLSGFDEMYGFSSIPKEQVKLFKKTSSARSAAEYYRDGDYMIAKFALNALKPEYTALDFHIEGFSLGANTKDVIVTSDDDSVEILKNYIGFCYKENPDDKEYKDFRGEFKSGVQYGLVIGYVVPEGYVVSAHPTVTLYGAGDNPVVADNAGICVGFVSDGRDMYLTAFHNMPILSEESDELAGDIDGDGKVTVSDALSVLRVAAKLAPQTKSTGSVFDFDGDGAVTVADALAILRIAAKLA